LFDKEKTYLKSFSRLEMAKHTLDVGLKARKQFERARCLKHCHPAAIRRATPLLRATLKSSVSSGT
jgi:hypothetical protein